LSLDKVRWLWSPDTDVILWLASFGRTETSASEDSAVQALVRAGHWLGALLIVAAVISLGLKHKAIVFAGLLCLAWTAGHILFFGEPRYHLPLLPLLLAIAGAGVLAVWRAAGAARPTRFGRVE
jgi:hypothetical protein